MLEAPLPGQKTEQVPLFTEDEEGESFMSAMMALGQTGG